MKIRGEPWSIYLIPAEDEDLTVVEEYIGIIC